MQQMIRIVHKFEGVEEWVGKSFERSPTRSSGEKWGTKG